MFFLGKRVTLQPKNTTRQVFPKDKIMKKNFTLAALAGLLILSACNKNEQFGIEGHVSNAANQTLIFEASSLQGIQVIDSVKLKSNGAFSFKSKRPESPDFFRLRLGDKVINLSIDSTETVRVTADAATFSTAYTVEGSENCQRIKELSHKHAILQEKTNALYKASSNGSIGMDVFQDSLLKTINNYKQDVKMNYIYADPCSTSAYFALFQQLNGYLIFDPLNSKEDVKCFAAVATGLNNLYPHADRSRNLYNIAIKGMKNTRQPREKVIEMEESPKEMGFIDISLRDLKGNIHKLSELKGKTILLDFTIYQSAISAGHNIQLNTLYEKYKDRGFEIYQVSLDADEHYWKTVADNLPWTCVRDGNGVYSTIAATYNVQSVPTLFIIDKKGEIQKRGEDINDLDAAVKAYL